MHLIEKKGKEGLVASFKQQVVVDRHHRSDSRTRVGVETPAVPLELCNCSTDPLVVTHLHALVFFQFRITML